MLKMDGETMTSTACRMATRHVMRDELLSLVSMNPELYADIAGNSTPLTTDLMNGAVGWQISNWWRDGRFPSGGS